MNSGIIKDWYFMLHPFNSKLIVAGIIAEHNEFTAGEDIVTSPVQKVERTTDGLRVHTRSNSLYLLKGKPASEWVSKLAEDSITVSDFLAANF